MSNTERDYFTRPERPEGTERAMDHRPDAQPTQPGAGQQTNTEQPTDSRSRAPWESAATDRSPLLPPQQPAPWQQSDAPWNADRPGSAPWDTDHESAPPPADAGMRHAEPSQPPAAPPAEQVEDGPVGIEVPPWDAPPPFTFDEPPADDPYDAYAPLAEDFVGAGEPVRGMTAPTIERPAPAAPGEERGSVFGDIFTRSAPPPEPAPMEDPATTPAEGPEEPGQWSEPAEWIQPGDESAAAPAEWTEPAEASAVAPAEWTEVGEESAADESTAEVWSADEDTTEEPALSAEEPALSAEEPALSAVEPEQPARDPVEWPPVPTDFTPPDVARSQHQVRVHDPLEWPPIPGQLLHVPDVDATPTTQPRVDQPTAQEPPAPEAPPTEAQPAAGPAAEWSAAGPSVEVDSPESFAPAEPLAEPSFEPAWQQAETAEFELQAADSTEPASTEPAWEQAQPAWGAWPAAEERIFAPPVEEGIEADEPAMAEFAAPATEPPASEPTAYAEQPDAAYAQPDAERPADMPLAIFEPPLPPGDADEVDDWSTESEAAGQRPTEQVQSAWAAPSRPADTQWAPFEPAVPEVAEHAEEDSHWVEPQSPVLSEPAYHAEQGDAGQAYGPSAPVFQPDPTGEQRGALFARYAGQATAPTVDSVAASAAQPAAREGTGDLWFLSGQGDAAAAGDEAAERHPSSVQTLVLTVLVAVAVIALAVLFLVLFTSFFR